MMGNEELELFRDTVVRFLADQVEPHYEKWEKVGIFPKELYLQMGEAGLLCVDQLEEYGGIGAPFAFLCVVVEEVERMGFLALASNLTVHSDRDRKSTRLYSSHQCATRMPFSA